MKLKLKSIAGANKCKSQESFEKPLKNCVKDRIMALTSTPVKTNERKSLSLLDISEFNVSSETLASSVCKDSGYNHSESSLSEKVKDEGSFSIDYRSQYRRLLEDAKFKDIMISSLHESNHSLRMRLAEAENKISELRFKSESHCRCCTYGSSNDSMPHKPYDRVNSQFQYSISPLTRSEPCLLINPPRKFETKRTSLNPVSQEEPSSLPCDDSFSKVKQWQNKLINSEPRKRLVNQISSAVPSSSIDSSRIYIRPVPESLPQTMSYMETSRALAETYRRRQDKESDLFSFQVIGDHSVSVSPVPLIRGQASDCADLRVNEFNNKSSTSNQESLKSPDQLSSRPNILHNILFRNQRSSGLFDCLNKANEYAATLAVGLSQLPSSLDQIRYKSGILPLFYHNSRDIVLALIYLFFSISFLCFIKTLIGD